MTDWLNSLFNLRQKSSRVVAGIMSGTSVDSVDVAFCRITGCGIPGRDGEGARIELLSLYSHPYDPELQKSIRQSGLLSAREFSELHAGIGELFAAAVVAGANQAGLRLEQLDLIGSHGQTIYHHSAVPGAKRVTLQLGCADRIAERTGKIVIFDFRSKDTATGGQGAPLAPYCDLVMFLPSLVADNDSVAVLNLGGIANFTALSNDPTKVLGFDTGPANSALDRLTRILTGGAQQFDIDGALARGGSVQQGLLQDLIKSDSFLDLPPPKSTGFEVYGDSWVKTLIERCGGTVTVDLLATATEFAALAIADALKRFILPTHPVSRVIAAGGGVNNLFLMERIASAIAPISLVRSDSLGVPSAAREAMAWAILANDTVCGIPTSLPSVTGCSRELVQGKVAFPG